MRYNGFMKGLHDAFNVCLIFVAVGHGQWGGGCDASLLSVSNWGEYERDGEKRSMYSLHVLL
jgi:hypothetical protein